MVRRVVDPRSFEAAQWGLIRLKGVKIDSLGEEAKARALHRLGQLVWRETVTIEIEGRELKSGCEAEVTLGKLNINQEMKRFVETLAPVN